MAKKLDRTRDFGEVMGHDGGAAFVQDEVLFDVDGLELNPAPVKAAAKPAQAKPAAKPTAPKPVAADEQIAAQLTGEPGDFAA